MTTAVALKVTILEGLDETEKPVVPFEPRAFEYKSHAFIIYENVSTVEVMKLYKNGDPKTNERLSYRLFDNRSKNKMLLFCFSWSVLRFSSKDELG
jgi:hypothetical protein